MRTFNLPKCVCVSALLMFLGVAAHAAQCSNASLKGSFGYASTTLADNDVPPSAWEMVGTFRFDGFGNATESRAYVTTAGAVVPNDVNLFTYSTAPDCTFTMRMNTSGETFAGVLVLDGQQFYFIETSGACCGTTIMRRGHGARIRTDN